MFEELRHERDGKIKKREELKQEYNDTPVENPNRVVILSKIRQIDAELKTEFYKVLEDRGEEVPKYPEAKVPSIIGEDFKKTIAEDEERIR
jgi:Zn-dependent peptidase ImmA (M78 family)